MTKTQLNHLHDYLMDAVDSLLSAADIVREAEPTPKQRTIHIYESLEDLAKDLLERKNEPFTPQ